MSNPYVILGISPSATDEEVKKAYKELAKKYHPDNYAESDLADFASEKMKEINLAYDTIIEERRNQRRNNENGYNANVNGEYSDVRQLINNNRIADAEQILNGIPRERRSAEWYFLKSMIFYKKGFLEDAFSHIEKACEMDSSNSEYRAAYNHINKSRNGEYGGYNTSRANHVYPCGCCDVCSTLICADCCCECCGGDLISCC